MSDERCHYLSLFEVPSTGLHVWHGSCAYTLVRLGRGFPRPGDECHCATKALQTDKAKTYRNDLSGSRRPLGAGPGWGGALTSDRRVRTEDQILYLTKRLDPTHMSSVRCSYARTERDPETPSDHPFAGRSVVDGRVAPFVPVGTPTTHGTLPGTRPGSFPSSVPDPSAVPPSVSFPDPVSPTPGPSEENKIKSMEKVVSKLE